MTRAIAILLAILHSLLAVTATIDKSPTFDEPVHLTAGYSYWLRNDFRLDSENGNLPARLAALPLLLQRPAFTSPNDPAWQGASSGLTTKHFFYASGNDPNTLLLPARAVMSLFGAALCLLIFFCGQDLFGPIAGLVSESIAVFDPNLLANNALVASDVASAFFFTAATWSVWRMCRRLSPGSLALAAISLAGLCLSKMSAPVLFPIAVALLGIRIIDAQPVEISVGRYQRELRAITNKGAALAVAMLIIATIAWASIWAAFGFRFNALTEGGRPREVLNLRWDYFLSANSPVSRTIGFARNHHLLPEAYLYGLVYTAGTTDSRPAFLDNHWSDTGFPSFFPRAFVYKTPLPILAVISLALVAALVRWTRRFGSFSEFCRNLWRDAVRLTPIWALLLTYTAFALTAKLDIGLRHLLPVYPALFIGCGAVVYLWRRERAAWMAPIIALLLAWQVIESFWIRPDYLAYFNQIAGGPANGYNHLVDSSLDWGQDLPSLAKWLEQNKGAATKVYLGYFGSADPASYGIAATDLSETNVSAVSLSPGLYCISATILQHVYEPESGRWCALYENEYQKALAWHNGIRKIALTPGDKGLERRRADVFQRLQFARLCAFLRHREPRARIGYSIFVYDLDRSTLEKALLGASPE